MKKIKYFILILIIFPYRIWALEYPETHYKNGIIYNISKDEVVYELNTNDKISIASLTKILTVITALEKIDNLNDKVIYTKEMSDLVRWDTSKAGLEIDETYTYEDLLYASILPSGADATVCLAISLSGNIDNFVKEMNNKASILGMNNSSFTNVIGLDDDNHYSTLSDLLILLKYAFNNDIFKTIYTTKEYTMSTGKQIKSTLYKYTKDEDISRILGSKTGYTLNALLCISAYFISNNNEYLIITTGTPKDSNYYNIQDVLTLINFIDSNYKEYKIINKDTLIKSINIKYSNINKLDIKSSKDIITYLPSDYNESLIKIEYIGINTLTPFNFKGSLIGKINYYYDNTLLDSENVYLNINIYPNKIIIISIIILIIFIILVYKYIKKYLIKIPDKALIYTKR